MKEETEKKIIRRPILGILSIFLLFILYRVFTVYTVRSGGGDLALIARAFGIEIGRGAVGDVRVGRIDVDVIEQVLLHEFEVLARRAHILIEVERRHFAETVVLARAVGHDALVHADGRAAGG